MWSYVYGVCILQASITAESIAQKQLPYHICIMYNFDIKLLVEFLQIVVSFGSIAPRSGGFSRTSKSIYLKIALIILWENFKFI